MTSVNIMASGIRVCQSLVGFGLFPGFTKKHRIDIEKLMSSALGKLINDLAGDYYLITGMGEGVRKQLVDDIFPFVIGDRNLTVAGMKRDWPDSHGIFHNAAGTFLLWVNEKIQMIILPMERGDVTGVFGCLARGIKTGGDFILVVTIRLGPLLPHDVA